MKISKPSICRNQYLGRNSRKHGVDEIPSSLLEQTPINFHENMQIRSGLRPVFYYKMNSPEGERVLRSECGGLKLMASNNSRKYGVQLPESQHDSKKPTTNHDSNKKRTDEYLESSDGSIKMAHRANNNQLNRKFFLSESGSDQLQSMFSEGSPPEIISSSTRTHLTARNIQLFESNPVKIGVLSTDSNQFQLQKDKSSRSSSSKTIKCGSIASMDTLDDITLTNENHDVISSRRTQQSVDYLQKSIVQTLEIERKLIGEIDEQERYFLLTSHQYWIAQRILYTKIAKLLQIKKMTMELVNAVAGALLQRVVDMLVIVDFGKRLDHEEAQTLYSQADDALVVLRCLRIPVKEWREKLDECKHWNTNRAQPLVTYRIPEIASRLKLSVTLPASYGEQIKEQFSMSDLEIQVDEESDRQPLTRQAIPKVGDLTSKSMKSIVEKKVLQMNLDILVEEMEHTLLDKGGSEKNLKSFKKASRNLSLSPLHSFEEYYKQFLNIKKSVKYTGIEHDILHLSHTFVNLLPRGGSEICIPSSSDIDFPAPSSLDSSQQSLSENELDSCDNTDDLLQPFDLAKLFSSMPNYSVDEKYLEEKWNHSLLNKMGELVGTLPMTESRKRQQFDAYHRAENSLTQWMHIEIASASNRDQVSKSIQESVFPEESKSSDDLETGSIYSVTSSGSLVSRYRRDSDSPLYNRNLTDEEIITFVQSKSPEFWRGLLKLCNSLPEIYRKFQNIPHRNGTPTRNFVLPNINRSDQNNRMKPLSNRNFRKNKEINADPSSTENVEAYLERSADFTADNVVRWQVLGLTFGTMMNNTEFSKSTKTIDLWVNVLSRLRNRLCSAVLAKIVLDIKCGSPTLATLQILQNEIEKSELIADPRIIIKMKQEN